MRPVASASSHPMYFHPRILLHTVVYGASLWYLSAREEPSVYFLVALAATLTFNVLAMRRTVYGGRTSALFLPWSFSILSAATLWFADEPVRANVFLALSCALFYLCILGGFRLSRTPGDLTAMGILGASLVATIFLFFSMLISFYLNFEVDSWFLLPIYFLTVFTLSYQHFKSIGGRIRAMSAKASFLLALFSTELYWISGYWPFGYLTTGIVMLIFYYVLWDLLQAHILGLLTKRRVVADMTVFVVLTAAVLATTRWTLIY